VGVVEVTTAVHVGLNNGGAVPTPEAEAREDAVVELVRESLNAAGLAAELTDRPDRSKATPGYTVDAEFDVNGARWALDIMTLRWNAQLESRTSKLAARLEADFTEQLKADGLVMRMTCLAPKDETALGRLVEMARRAVETVKSVDAGDEGVSLYARPPDWPSDEPPVEVSPWLGEHAHVQTELVSSFGESLAKKLQGQLARARSFADRVGLAIDQVGARDLRFGANWMAAPETVELAVTEVEREVGLKLDFLVLIPANGQVRWLRG